MKPSKQGFSPENRLTDSQITNCFGFNLQIIIFEAGDTTTEILLGRGYILFCFALRS